MGKIIKNCLDCKKRLSSKYAKRCIFCDRKVRSLNPEYMKKLSNAKKGKRPKNFIEMQKKGWIKRTGSYYSVETRRKMSESHKGEKCYLWKGGISSINEKIRRNVEYRIWREAVFKRDNYTCIWCGIRSQKGIKVILNADHIKPFALYPELRLAIDNGRTLCESCHRKTDTWGGNSKKHGSHY